MWFDDEWVARALNELKMLVVVSRWDLAIRTIFSLGIVITTASMKELLRYRPGKGNQIGHGVTPVTPSWEEVCKQTSEITDTKVSASTPGQLSKYNHWQQILLKRGRWMLRAAHLAFVVWSASILALHVHASLQPDLPHCLMQVRPWAASSPACYLAALDCYKLNISGKKDEAHAIWSEFDSSVVVHVLIRHCPALEVPDVVRRFRCLRGIKVYNTTVVEWGESAALTDALHPALATLYIVRINFTDGILPPGFQSAGFPQALYDIELCATNIRALPDDLDTKWSQVMFLQVEYSQLTTFPTILLRVQPYYFIVTGNPIAAIPPDAFETPGIAYLGVSDTNVQELPRNVTRPSPDLTFVFIGETNISFFWSWVDELLVNRQGSPFVAPQPFVAEGSAYCNDLEKLENGSSQSFRVPVSPEYSSILTDPSPGNRQAILNGVNCDAKMGVFYPITIEDDNNAISVPPPLVKPPPS